mmetsp:Transcript_14826/g.32199  ORF Transcript_14826/g.32199 Transcript_14826/m.32199 type:complete len:224 (+) Transcript_14826:206-877(+)
MSTMFLSSSSVILLGNSSWLLVSLRSATTHTDLLLRAKQQGIEVKVVHNASIMNAVGCCGLQLYNFGQTVSIPYFTKLWRPFSFLDKLVFNKRNGQHTLCLLDIKVKEVSEENMMRGRQIYEPPRFMSVNEALEQMVEAIENKQEECEGVLSKDTLVVGLARVGQEDQQISFGTISELLTTEFGAPLHCLVVPGQMHDLERDCLLSFRDTPLIAAAGAAVQDS